jgi:selenide,water dikinase
VRLDWGAIPALPGAADCIQAGTLSSLHAQNARAAASITNFPQLTAATAQWPLLMDPQTAGGLLAAVPAGQAGACLAALRAAGYVQAAAIGEVTPQRGGSEPAGDVTGASAPGSWQAAAITVADLPSS